MARASIRSLCIAACALVVLGATCRRQPATTDQANPPAGDAGGATGDAGTPADTTAAPLLRLRGLIAPHAGYEYSGAVAAWSWKQLEGSGAGAAGEVGGSVFTAQVAGGFYPGDAATLRAQVQGFLGADEKRTDLRVGPVATVVLMAPSHHYPFSGAAALAEDAYETPLGTVGVDTALRGRLVELAGGDVVVDSGYFREEHALEVQLPFLQTVLPNAKVLPLIVGESNIDQLERLGRAVAKLLEERDDVFLVASSDMSHFYTYDEATAFDQANLAALEALDLDTYDRTGNGQSGMCGYNPVRVALVALKEIAGAGAKVLRLKYANSGDVTGDHERVVGYGALALVQEEGTGAGSGAGSGATAGAEGNMFSREERQALIDIAKAAVRAAARGERYAPAEPTAESLRRNGAAFVTLKESGQLRGCIGHVIATEPLYECVAEVARAAAIEDPRFDPVEPRELDQLSYEISVLTPPEVVTDPTTIQVGRDGLIMSRGGRRGLLLPQVPEEQGWDREQFLDGTCRKAGLPAGCWREPGTRIERFQAIVWGESLEDILT
jgi:AmmeMemoRadiSam system protein A/AmmeMemoRadiSam system protein B